MDTQLRIDTRGLAIAGLVGLTYLALGAPMPLALVVVVVVYALNALFTRRPKWRPSATLPALEPGTPETTWVERATLAVSSIDQLSRSARSEAISQRCAAIALQAGLAVGSLQRLAFQASVVSGMARSADIGALRSDEDRARAQLRDVTGPRRLELEHTVASLAARRESAERLASTHRDLADRIQAGALGLEGIVARVAEIVALTDDTSRAMPIDDLASEIDALRAALVAGESYSDHAFDTSLATQNGER